MIAMALSLAWVVVVVAILAAVLLAAFPVDVCDVFDADPGPWSDPW